MKKIIVSIIVMGLLLTSITVGTLGQTTNDINAIKNELNSINSEKQLSGITLDEQGIQSFEIYNSDFVEKTIISHELVVNGKYPANNGPNTTISGYVIDSNTGLGVANAKVNFRIWTEQGVIVWDDQIWTNESGYYFFNIYFGPPTRYGYGFVYKTGYNDLRWEFFDCVPFENNAVGFYLDTKPRAHADGNGEYSYGSVGEVGENLEFVASGSDVNGQIVLYEWDFDGDGIFDWSSPNGGSTFHSYNTPGIHTATLKVTDNEGHTGTDYVDCYILESKQLQPHNRISIVGNSGFKPTNGVVGGDGTKNNPYIIEGWEIDGDGKTGIAIRFTDAHVIVRNVTIINGYRSIVIMCSKNVIVENCIVLNSLCSVAGIDSEITLKDNIFLASNDGWDHFGLTFAPTLSKPIKTLIYGNVIVGYGPAIGSMTPHFTIIQNNIVNHCDYGVLFYDDFPNDPPSNLFVYHNLFDSRKTNNGGDGLDIMPTGCNFVEYNVIKRYGPGIIRHCEEYGRDANFYIKNNSITYSCIDMANVESGFRNLDYELYSIDATYNWWGSPEGPGQDGFGPRTRASVGVIADPFLTAPPANVGPTTNPPPNKPVVNGPTNGKAGVEYTYTATATDPEGEDIYYLFDWDDGNYSNWLGPYASGETISITYTWEKIGVYKVWVITKDSYGCISDRSDPLSVIMPINYQSNPQSTQSNQLLQRMLQQLPNAFPILRQLLGL